ncbi:MAG: DNA sulfur modification protein DndB, partial [Chloroflexia bacterium]
EEKGTGASLLQIPYDVQIVAIDGETQLAARFEAARMNPGTKGDRIAVVICHGRPATWARQAFHDVNTFGIRPNAALAIGMDARDPLTSVARMVEDSVPFFKGRVNTSSRQLGKQDTEVITITALRRRGYAGRGNWWGKARVQARLPRQRKGRCGARRGRRVVLSL